MDITRRLQCLGYFFGLSVGVFRTDSAQRKEGGTLFSIFAARATTLTTPISSCFLPFSILFRIPTCNVKHRLTASVKGHPFKIYVHHLAVVVLVAAIEELPNTHANHHLLHAHTSPSPTLSFPFPLPLALLHCCDIAVDVAFLGLVFRGYVSSLRCGEALNRKGAEGVSLYGIVARISELLRHRPSISKHGKHLTLVQAFRIIRNCNQRINIRYQNCRSSSPTCVCLRCCF